MSLLCVLVRPSLLSFCQAHKAKNLGALGGGRGKDSAVDEGSGTVIDVVEEGKKEGGKEEKSVQQTTGTKAAMTVIKLQKDLPMARVVYVSATGAVSAPCCWEMGWNPPDHDFLFVIALPCARTHCRHPVFELAPSSASLVTSAC